jgi:chromosome condensin MukBEF ATPase and DNA-binding subunit MukB
VRGLRKERDTAVHKVTLLEADVECARNEAVAMLLLHDARKQSWRREREAMEACIVKLGRERDTLSASAGTDKIRMKALREERDALRANVATLEKRPPADDAATVNVNALREECANLNQRLSAAHTIIKRLEPYYLRAWESTEEAVGATIGYTKASTFCTCRQCTPPVVPKK